MLRIYLCSLIASLSLAGCGGGEPAFTPNVTLPATPTVSSEQATVQSVAGNSLSTPAIQVVTAPETNLPARIAETLTPPVIAPEVCSGCAFVPLNPEEIASAPK